MSTRDYKGSDHGLHINITEETARTMLSFAKLPLSLLLLLSPLSCTLVGEAMEIAAQGAEHLASAAHPSAALPKSSAHVAGALASSVEYSSALGAPVAMDIEGAIETSISNAAEGKKIEIGKLPEGMIVRPVAASHDGITQGPVGSCHIFATQALMKDATGITVSAARMFLDHLINYGQHETVHGTAKAIGQINMDHVLGQRAVTAGQHCDLMWEGGYIQDNLQLMQTIGGVIVPNNEDYKEVVTLMKKLEKERKAVIQTPGPLLRSAHTKLQNGGLEEVIQKALSPTDSSGRIILGDRGIVLSEAQKIRVQDVTFHTAKSVTTENMKKAIATLVKKLETNAIYLAVDSEKYWPALYKGEHIAMEGAKYSEKADHAIVLVGYEMGNGVFFVMDSNNPAVAAIDARDLVLSTAYAAIFKKRA